jgi:arginyl-tRNA synthetase
MSTRKGNVIKLEDILDTAPDTMHNIMPSNDEKYAQIENPAETASLGPGSKYYNLII